MERSWNPRLWFALVLVLVGIVVIFLSGVLRGVWP